MYFTTPDDQELIEGTIDEFGDSYCRDITPDELRKVFDGMPTSNVRPDQASTLLAQLEEQGLDVDEAPGWMLRDMVVYFDRLDTTSKIESAEETQLKFAERVVQMTGGSVSKDIDDITITQVVVGEDRERLKVVRESISHRQKIPRLVTLEWIETSWKEKTLLDEERFAP